MPGQARWRCWHSLTHSCNSSLTGPWGCGEHLQIQPPEQGEPLWAAWSSKVLGVSKGVSTELIGTKNSCQKDLAVHSSPLLASAEPSVRVEGETIPTQLELDANKLSMLSWSRSCRVCWDGGESSSTPASWDPPQDNQGDTGSQQAPAAGSPPCGAAHGERCSWRSCAVGPQVCGTVRRRVAHGGVACLSRPEQFTVRAIKAMTQLL